MKVREQEIGHRSRSTRVGLGMVCCIKRMKVEDGQYNEAAFARRRRAPRRNPSVESSLKHSVVLCFVIPFILDVRIVDAPAGVTQEEGYTQDFSSTFLLRCLP